MMFYRRLCSLQGDCDSPQGVVAAAYVCYGICGIRTVVV
jgi:hypothetical protein